MDVLEDGAVRRFPAWARGNLPLHARVTRFSCVMMGDDANEGSSQEKER
jgi:hypothetical protein